ncbi:uncharacterized protein [Nicotiana tomentosiformis]|uniref:uncharacterized protein n=1 Tax=Nicotiana tomentosiformis TaxID=4098 RepID=UPI00388CCE72
MDVIGPIDSATSNGRRFILVSIDYFTKLVEASTYKVIPKKVVPDFVRNNIVCIFGIPESIITNNAANRNSTAHRPKMYGEVEAANQNISRILWKIVDNHR